MHHITQIYKVEPFKIHCVFDVKESRIIDFAELINNADGDCVSKLKDEKIFLNAKLDHISKTIYWEDLALMKDYDGTIKPCELDFDPTVLYYLSRSL